MICNLSCYIISGISCLSIMHFVLIFLMSSKAVHIIRTASLAFFPSMQHSVHDDQEFPKRDLHAWMQQAFHVFPLPLRLLCCKRNWFHKWNRLTSSCGLCDCEESGQIMQIKGIETCAEHAFQLAQGAAALEHMHMLLLLGRYTSLQCLLAWTILHQEDCQKKILL